MKWSSLLSSFGQFLIIVFSNLSVLYQIGVVDESHHMCLVFYVITEKEYIAPSCCRDFAEKGFLSWLIRCLMFGIVLSANTFGFRVTKTSPAQIAG